MTEIQRLKRMLRLTVEAMPFLVFCVVLMVLVARYWISVTTPVYEAVAKMRLDDQSFGVSQNNLYEDFDVFSTKNRVETEVQVLGSPLILDKAAESLDLFTSYLRVGRVDQHLFSENPFHFEVEGNREKLIGNRLEFEVSSDRSILLFIEDEEVWQGRFNQPFELCGVRCTLMLNEEYYAFSHNYFQGRFAIEIHDRIKLVQQFMQQVDVVSIDKEVDVVRVAFKHNSPEISAALANAICSTYIDDYVQHRSKSASRTLDFVDDQLDLVNTSLEQTEVELEQYKLDNDVVNTLQETETNLRKLSDLNKEFINVKLREKEIQSLDNYIKRGNYFDENVPPFGFGDLLFVELMKKIELNRSQRLDLLILYKPDHPKVKVHEQKIEELVIYIKEAIEVRRDQIENQLVELDQAIAIEKKFFDPIPTREKELHRLERSFNLNERAYNFLQEKRMEAAISEAAQISFHRIIQSAQPPSEAVNPNRVLITFMSGLLGLLTGVGVLVMLHLLFRRIEDLQDLEKSTLLPVSYGVNEGLSSEADFGRLAAFAEVQGVMSNGKLAVMVSAVEGHSGRQFMAAGLAKAFARAGYRSRLIRLNDGPPDEISGVESLAVSGVAQSPANVSRWLETQMQDCDRLVLEVRLVTEVAEAISLAKTVGFTYLIARCRGSQPVLIGKGDEFAEKAGLENVSWALYNPPRLSLLNRYYRSAMRRVKGHISNLQNQLSGKKPQVQ